MNEYVREKKCSTTRIREDSTVATTQPAKLPAVIRPNGERRIRTPTGASGRIDVRLVHPDARKQKLSF